MRQTIKTGFIVLVVAALTMTGFALAQEGTDDTAESPTATIDFADRIREQLQGLVDEGVLDSGQADAVAETFAEFQQERQAARQERFEQKQANRQAVLDLLGLTREELHEAFQNDQSLADVAGEQTGDVIALIVSQMQDKIASAVENGRLTQEEADEKLATLEADVTEKVNTPPSEREGNGHHGPGGRRGPGGGPGFGGPGFGGPPAEDAATTSA